MFLPAFLCAWVCASQTPAAALKTPVFHSQSLRPEWLIGAAHRWPDLPQPVPLPATSPGGPFCWHTSRALGVVAIPVAPSPLCSLSAALVPQPQQQRCTHSLAFGIMKSISSPWRSATSGLLQSPRFPKRDSGLKWPSGLFSQWDLIAVATPACLPRHASANWTGSWPRPLLTPIRPSVIQPLWFILVMKAWSQSRLYWPSRILLVVGDTEIKENVSPMSSLQLCGETVTLVQVWWVWVEWAPPSSESAVVTDLIADLFLNLHRGLSRGHTHR